MHAQAAPAQVGVIGSSSLIENIGDRLPTNVIKLHFGALTSGRNDMERVASMIVNPTDAKPADVEHAAAVLTGVHSRCCTARVSAAAEPAALLSLMVA